MCAEALAPLIALHHNATRLANQQVLWFVDNVGAVEVHPWIRLARKRRMNTLRQCKLHCCRHKFGMHERVDDASDPSDGLSRVGADCPLCKRNGWSVQEIVPTGILRTLSMDVRIFRLDV